ncbi:hypothetical protein [Profundibacter sp.]|uniref:hypothetical protein n=1 Tax=Profundibacter sp. TaxID=3101071 RepID=UPI003D0DF066
MDAADLLTGDRLLNDDGSKAEVVLSDVLAEPLRAYNLTVEGAGDKAAGGVNPALL